jgi:hypothetical protein
VAVFNHKAALAVTFTTLLLGLKAATSALTIPLLLSRIGADQTALWVLVQTTWNYAFFAELGLGQVLMIRVGAARAKNDWDNVSRVATTGIAVTLGLSLGLALASFLFVRYLHPAAFLLGRGSADIGRLSHLLAIVLPAAMLRILGTAFAGLLSGLDDHHIRTALDAVQPAVVLIAVVATILRGRSLETTVTVFAVTSVVVSLLPAIFLSTRHPGCVLRLRHLCLAEAKVVGTMVRSYVALPFLLSMHRSLPVFLAARVLPLSDLPGIYLLSMYARLFFVNLMDSVSKSIQPAIIALHADRGSGALRRGWLEMSSTIGLAASALLPLMIVVYGRYVEPAAHINPRTPFVAVCAFAAMFWLDSSISVGTNYMLAIGEFRRLTWAWTLGLAAKLVVVGIGAFGGFLSTPASFALVLLGCDALLYFPANLAVFSKALRSPFLRTFQTIQLPWLCVSIVAIAACGLIEMPTEPRPVAAAAALCLSTIALLVGQRFLPVRLRLWLRNRLQIKRLQILFN